MKKMTSATIANAKRTGCTIAPPAMAMINRTMPAINHNMSIPSFLGLVLPTRIPGTVLANLEDEKGRLRVNGRCRDRTSDLFGVNEALSQLS
jgi:hypothetical protein